VRLSVTVSGTNGVKGIISKIAAKVGEPRPAMQLIGQTLLDDYVLPSFKNQRSPDGAKWPPLKRSTLDSLVPGTAETTGVPGAAEAGGRRRWTYSELALVRRRLLRNSFNYDVAGDGQSVSIGTPFAFFKYHQQMPNSGLPAGKGIIPKRAALPEPQGGGQLKGSIMSDLASVLSSYLEDQA